MTVRLTEIVQYSRSDNIPLQSVKPSIVVDVVF